MTFLWCFLLCFEPFELWCQTPRMTSKANRAPTIFTRACFLKEDIFWKKLGFSDSQKPQKLFSPPITTGCTKMCQWLKLNVSERGMLWPTEPIFGQSKCREWIIIDSSAKNEHFRFKIERKWNIPVPLFEWLAYWFLFWPEFTGQCFFRMDCSQFLC